MKNSMVSAMLVSCMLFLASCTGQVQTSIVPTATHKYDTPRPSPSVLPSATPQLTHEFGNAWCNYANSSSVALVGDKLFMLFSDRIYQVFKDSSKKIYKYPGVGYNRLDHLSFSQNYFYFTNLNDDTQRVYRMSMDGKQVTKLYEVKADGIVNMMVIDSWIYVLTNDLDIVRLKSDRTQKTVLLYGKAMSFATDGNWIYYTDQNNKDIYKMRMDGTEEEKVATLFNSNSNMQMEHIMVAGDWIYYLCSDRVDKYAFGKVKTDGTQKKNYSNSKIYSANVCGDWIYFGDEIGLQKMRLDGTQITKIADFGGYLNMTKIQIVGNVIVCDYMYGGENGDYGEVETFVRPDGSQQNAQFLVPESDQ